MWHGSFCRALAFMNLTTWVQDTCHRWRLSFFQLQVLRVEDLHRKLEGLEAHLPELVASPAPVASGGTVKEGQGEEAGDAPSPVAGDAADSDGDAPSSTPGGTLASVLPPRPVREAVDAALQLQREVGSHGAMSST